MVFVIFGKPLFFIEGICRLVNVMLRIGVVCSPENIEYETFKNQFHYSEDHLETDNLVIQLVK